MISKNEYCLFCSFGKCIHWKIFWMALKKKCSCITFFLSSGERWYCILCIHSTYFMPSINDCQWLETEYWPLDVWQSSKVWFMLQSSNWQHFLSLQAAPLTFLTYLKTLGDIYLALNCAGCSQIIYLCLELPLNKEQTCFCGCISLRKYRFT